MIPCLGLYVVVSARLFSSLSGPEPFFASCLALSQLQTFAGLFVGFPKKPNRKACIIGVVACSDGRFFQFLRRLPQSMKSDWVSMQFTLLSEQILYL
jgi:hypothetical protein